MSSAAFVAVSCTEPRAANTLAKGQHSFRDDVVRECRFPIFSASGERIACLRIASARPQYGRKGIFRVAWRPQLALCDLELEIYDPTEWSATRAAEVAQSIGGLFSCRDIVIEHARVIFWGEVATEFRSQTAQISSDGTLVLPSPEEICRRKGAAGDPTPRFSFALFLSGPRAGEWECKPARDASAVVEEALECDPT